MSKCYLRKQIASCFLTDWTKRKTNLEILIEVKVERRLLQEMESKNIKSVGYIIRQNEFIINMLEGKVMEWKAEDVENLIWMI